MGRKGAYKRADGVYQIRFVVDGKRYSVYAKTVAEAEKKAFQKRLAIQENYIDNAKITLSEYYEEWQKRREGSIKKATRYAQDRRFEKIKKALGHKKVAKLETREIVAFRDSLKEELTTQGTNDCMDLLKSVLNSAVCDRIITYNPMNGVKRLKRTETKATQTIHRALTEKEAKQFFQCAEDSYYYNLFRFLYSTGMRTGEAAALLWSDIDYKHEVIHITKTVSRTGNKEITVTTPKTESSCRDIPLSAGVKKILADQKKMQNALRGVCKVISLDSIVFPTQKGGYVVPSNLCTVIRKILEKAAEDGVEIQYFSPHAFRDSYATRAAEQGVDMQVLRDLLGHSSLSLTMDLYAQVLPERMKSEAQKIRIVV